MVNRRDRFNNCYSRMQHDIVMRSRRIVFYNKKIIKNYHRFYKTRTLDSPIRLKTLRGIIKSCSVYTRNKINGFVFRLKLDARCYFVFFSFHTVLCTIIVRHTSVYATLRFLKNRLKNNFT